MRHFIEQPEEEFSVSMIPDCPETAQWYCVIVKPSWSAAVSAELYGLGHRTFTPKAKRWRNHARRKSVVESPIAGMSNYLFVEIDYPKQSFAQVRAVRGVVEIMSTAGKPIPFSRKLEDGTHVDPVIEFVIREMKGEWDEIEAAPLPIGAKVRVMEGPNENKLAVITSQKGKKIFAKVEGQSLVSTFFRSSLKPYLGEKLPEEQRA
jgi:transcription antitermination factor NusG